MGQRNLRRGFKWEKNAKRPNFPGGGLQSPFAADGLEQFDHPSTLASCRVVALGGILDPDASGPKEVVAKLHVKWGHAPAHQPKRVLMDAGGDTRGLLGRVDWLGP